MGADGHWLAKLMSMSRASRAWTAWTLRKTPPHYTLGLLVLAVRRAEGAIAMGLPAGVQG